MKVVPRRVLVGVLGLILVLAGWVSVALAQTPIPETPTPLPADATPAAPGVPNLGPEINQMLAALETKDVYVSPAAEELVPTPDQLELEALAADLNNRGYAIRIVVISGVPGGLFENLSHFTDELHNYLELDRGILIVATRMAVAAQSRRLDKDEMQELTDRSRQIFQSSGYAAGIRGLAQSLVDKIQEKQANNARLALMIFFGLLILLFVGLVIFLILRRNRWQRAIALARQEHHRLQAAAELIGPEIQALPRGQWAVEAQRVFEPIEGELEALGKQVQAVSRANFGQIIFRSGDWELVLKDAMAGLHDSRSGLKRAQEMAAQASPTFRPVPLPVPIQPVLSSSGTGISADELQARLAAYGGPPTACFFCAQPLQATLAAQVEANLGGRWRQLLACPHHANEVTSGAEPMVRSIETEEGHIPWFADRDFVPYRDYDPQYTRGIALDDLEGYLFALETSAVVITAEDSRWIEFQTDGGGDSRGGPPPITVEAADLSEYAPPAGSVDAAYDYAQPTVYQASGTGLGAFPLLPESTPAETGAFGDPGLESLAPDLRAAFERAVREAEQGPGGPPDAPLPAAQDSDPVGIAPPAPGPAAFHPDYGVAPGAVRPAWPDLPAEAEDRGTTPGGADIWAIPPESVGWTTDPTAPSDLTPTTDAGPAPWPADPVVESGGSAAAGLEWSILSDATAWPDPPAGHAEPVGATPTDTAVPSEPPWPEINREQSAGVADWHLPAEPSGEEAVWAAGTAQDAASWPILNEPILPAEPAPTVAPAFPAEPAQTGMAGFHAAVSPPLPPLPGEAATPIGTAGPWPVLPEVLTAAEDPWQTPLNGLARDGRDVGPAWAEPSVAGVPAGDVTLTAWPAQPAAADIAAPEPGRAPTAADPWIPVSAETAGSPPPPTPWDAAPLEPAATAVDPVWGIPVEPPAPEPAAPVDPIDIWSLPSTIDPSPPPIGSEAPSDPSASAGWPVDPVSASPWTAGESLSPPDPAPTEAWPVESGWLDDPWAEPPRPAETVAPSTTRPESGDAPDPWLPSPVIEPAGLPPPAPQLPWLPAGDLPPAAASVGPAEGDPPATSATAAWPAPNEPGAPAPAAGVPAEDVVWELPVAGLTLNWDALEEDDEPRPPTRRRGESPPSSGDSKPARRPPPPPVITDPAALGGRPAPTPPPPPASAPPPDPPAAEDVPGETIESLPIVPPKPAPPAGQAADAQDEDAQRRTRRALGRGLGQRPQPRRE